MDLAQTVRPLARPPFGTGASVTVSVRDRTTTTSEGTLHDRGLSVAEGARFNVASVSKVVTAARIVSLARTGAIDLDDPIARHLPGVRLPDATGIDRAPSITVRHLLRHESGLPHQPKDLEAAVARAGGDWSAPDLLRKLTNRWQIALERSPGTFHYSNTGYALLGAVLERVRGCSFADCMATYLDELAMRRSSFWPATLGTDAAHGHVRRDGETTVNTPNWYASRYALPFTGLWTSTSDLATFGRVLVDAARDRDAPLHPMTIRSAELGLFPRTRADRRTLEHDGSGPGFHAALVVVPESEVVVALASNGGSESKAEAEAFAEVLEHVVEVVSPR